MVCSSRTNRHTLQSVFSHSVKDTSYEILVLPNLSLLKL